MALFRYDHTTGHLYFTGENRAPTQHAKYGKSTVSTMGVPAAAAARLDYPHLAMKEGEVWKEYRGASEVAVVNTSGGEATSTVEGAAGGAATSTAEGAAGVFAGGAATSTAEGAAGGFAGGAITSTAEGAAGIAAAAGGSENLKNPSMSKPENDADDESSDCGNSSGTDKKLAGPGKTMRKKRDRDMRRNASPCEGTSSEEKEEKTVVSQPRGMGRGRGRPKAPQTMSPIMGRGRGLLHSNNRK